MPPKEKSVVIRDTKPYKEIYNLPEMFIHAAFSFIVSMNSTSSNKSQVHGFKRSLAPHFDAIIEGTSGTDVPKCIKMVIECVMYHEPFRRAGEIQTADDLSAQDVEALQVKDFSFCIFLNCL